MKPWQVDGLNRLEKTGYLHVLRKLVRSHSCPFWWYDDDAPVGRAILHNGTISFVNTGKTTLGITANHVFEEYLKEKATNSKVKCQIGNVTVEPERHVISSDKTVDIATLQLPTILIAATGVTVHSAPVWPPENLRESDLVICGGYPGIRRKENVATAEFDFVSFISRINQCSGDHVSIYLNIPGSHWPQGESVGGTPNLGGASGGPMFRLRTEPLETIELAGVIYEYNQEFELVFARHASHVSSDGLVEP
jgi:hypothetical protein